MVQTDDRRDALPTDRAQATAEVGVVPGDPELVFRVRPACDQACLFCGADTRHEPIVAEPAALAAAYRAHPDRERCYVVLSGGEPTAGARLPEQVAAVVDAGARTVMVQTNGMRLSEPRVLDALAPYREQVFFLVSLHSHRADVSDLLTRSRGGHLRTLAGLDAALALGFRAWINHVLNTLNFFELERFVRFVRPRWPTLSQLVLSFVNPVHEAARRLWLVPPLEAVAPHLRAGLTACRDRSLAVAVSEVCGVPACLVRGFESTHDAFATGRPDIPSPASLPDTRAKGPRCADCRWNPGCLGVWKAYARRHGFDALVPVVS